MIPVHLQRQQQENEKFTKKFTQTWKGGFEVSSTGIIRVGVPVSVYRGGAFDEQMSFLQTLLRTTTTINNSFSHAHQYHHKYLCFPRVWLSVFLHASKSTPPSHQLKKSRSHNHLQATLPQTEASSTKLPFHVSIAEFHWWKSTTGRQTFPLTPQMEWIDGWVEGRTEGRMDDASDRSHGKHNEREQAWKKVNWATVWKGWIWIGERFACR